MTDNLEARVRALEGHELLERFEAAKARVEEAEERLVVLRADARSLERMWEEHERREDER